MIKGLVVDLFAGGGGASTGIANAIGRDPDIAINHDADALAMHEANHPASLHYQEDIWQVNPAEVCGPDPVALLWASPDCTHFSKAKGGKPRDKNIRSLAWVVVKWAEAVKPRLIMLENVEEFKTWGPLDDEGQPIKTRKGETFAQWLGKLRDLGYEVEYRELRASEYGAPTIRKRLFVIARCDGGPIIWPEPTHGPKDTGMLAGFGKQPYRTAAECIDWSLPCPSIFDRKKPLAEATLRRIARGIKRYVIEAEQPFIVHLTHQGGDRARGVEEPLSTVTGAHRGEQAVVVPTLVQTGYGEAPGQSPRSIDIQEPLGTVVGSGKHAVVVPYLAGVGGRMGESPERPVDAPYHTTTSKADTVVVAPTLVGITHNKAGDHITDPADEPLRTVTTSKGGEQALVETTLAPFLARTAYKGANGSYVEDAREPARTITAQNDGYSVVSPVLEPVEGEVESAAFLTRFNQNGVGSEITEPVDTVMAGAPRFGLTVGFLAKHNGGHEATGQDLAEPTATVTARDGKALVAGHVTKLYGTSEAGAAASEPMPTVSAQGQHIGAVYALLTAYYGNEQEGQSLAEPLRTVTSKERFALVYIHGEPYAIVDIGMRMLTPRELFRAQGFPDDYVIEEVEGRKLTKTAQIRMCGNSVCPPVAEALVRANVRTGARMGRGGGDMTPSMRERAAAAADRGHGVSIRFSGTRDWYCSCGAPGTEHMTAAEAREHERVAHGQDNPPQMRGLA